MSIQDIIEYITTPAAQITIIICLSEILKAAGLKKKFIPIADLIMGIAVGIFVYGYMMGYGIAQGAAVGVVLGLSACGLFSGVKNTMEIGDNDRERDQGQNN